MASEALSDQLTGVANPVGGAGLAGGTAQSRASQYGGKKRWRKFTFTIPATGAGSGDGDTVVVSYEHPMHEILRARILIPSGGLGAGTTIDLGKYDPNTATTSATRYISGADSSVAGVIEADNNLYEQVGSDPAGDQSTGNVAPGFGSQQVKLYLTLHGTLTAAKQIKGEVEFAVE